MAKTLGRKKLKAKKTTARKGARRSGIKKASPRAKKPGGATAKKMGGSGVEGLVPAAALTSVRLGMPSGPEALVTTGDVYRKALPNDPKVASNVMLRRTQAANLPLPAGSYYYAFDINYGAGDFTLESRQGGAVTATKPYTNAPPSGNVFPFPVT